MKATLGKKLLKPSHSCVGLGASIALNTSLNFFILSFKMLLKEDQASANFSEIFYSDPSGRIVSELKKKKKRQSSTM